jgi:4-hydroxymandelate synthase
VSIKRRSRNSSLERKVESGMKVTDIDHVEFYVADERLFSFYLRAGFGFQLAGHTGPGGGSALLAKGGIRVVVTSSAGGTGPVREFTGRHGDGVAVIGLGVDDTRAAFDRAVAAGAVAITEPAEHRVSLP